MGLEVIGLTTPLGLPAPFLLKTHGPIACGKGGQWANGRKSTHAGEQAGSRAQHGCTILTYLPSSQVPMAPAGLGVTWEAGAVPWCGQRGGGSALRAATPVCLTNPAKSKPRKSGARAFRWTIGCWEHWGPVGWGSGQGRGHLAVHPRVRVQVFLLLYSQTVPLRLAVGGARQLVVGLTCVFGSG